jgi:hypothetical protein
VINRLASPPVTDSAISRPKMRSCTVDVQWWGWVLAALVVVPPLAWFGRPDDKPILSSATVPVAFETLTLEVIIRALEGLRIAGINQALAKDRANANAGLRMCLKVMGQVENDMVPGTSIYKNGIRATMFARDDTCGILSLAAVVALMRWANRRDVRRLPL